MLKQGISRVDLRAAICDDSPEVIEDYPDDWRGPACLVLGWADMVRPVHVVVGYGHSPEVAVEVVTVYEPDARQWRNHRVRI